MNVKQGDFVSVNGIESIVETSWSQGAHKAFKLSDGRVILDLDKLVAANKAQVVNAPIVQPVVEEPIKKKWSV